MNSLKQLQQYGQSIWLDSISRRLITSGSLARLVQEDGLRGVTSNPAIFEKAIAGSADYAEDLRELAPRSSDAKALYEALAIRDVQLAADVLRPVWEESHGRDGHVSLEVSPRLAHDLEGTLAEARRLWTALDRPNAMIKVPATPAGILAVEQLIDEGLNVNVTLLFSLAAYERVARAYLAGLARRAARGDDVTRVASVASFFVSRVDAAVDELLQARIASAPDSGRAPLQALLGTAAIANARLAWQRSRALFAGPAWEVLAARGAQRQRVLWASTGTKDPAYRDVRYVEELIGPDTVNTAPPATIDLFRDHGVARASVAEGAEAARAALEALGRSGISLDQATDRLLEDGLRLFVVPFDKLLASVEQARMAALAASVRAPVTSLPPPLASALRDTAAEWLATKKLERLWARDARLWTGRDEASWLDWLDVTEQRASRVEAVRALTAEVRSRGDTDVVLLGMGGSSLAPEVMSQTFGRPAGAPRFHVLDSTDPARVREVVARLDLTHTLIIAASKSGSTLEPNIFLAYVFGALERAVGRAEAGRRLVVITDPGSKMEQVARELGAAHVFPGVPGIGGRYSALSNFGLVPAAVMGVDVGRLLDRTEVMVRACQAEPSPADNPGAQLGLILGLAARQGRDKLTLVTSPGVRALGAWLEQLVAESTGKQGMAIIPVDLERLGPPAVYGKDRIFVSVALDGDPEPAQGQALSALEKAGHPVVRIGLADVGDLGQEFFRWEVATAVAGAVLGINPFDQPDVEASKIETRKLTDAAERSGALPPEAPFWVGEGVKLFADKNNADALSRVVGPERTLASWLRAHLDRLRPGDYAALLAYVEMSQANQEALQSARHAIRDVRRVATCLGFGPRFLHSTGQAYKGGPATGVILQVTCDDAADLPVPGHGYTFGLVKAAQARGDLQVLADRGRRLLRVHLSADVAAGLEVLRAAVVKALA
jgi:transaldolase/glucose-6-phosphate isomerase